LNYEFMLKKRGGYARHQPAESKISVDDKDMEKTTLTRCQYNWSNDFQIIGVRNGFKK